MCVFVSLSVGHNHEGSGPSQEKGQFCGLLSLLIMHCNSEITENGYINYTVYIPTDSVCLLLRPNSVWPQQSSSLVVAGVVRLQIHSCIFAKKQFGKTNYVNHCL